MAEDEHISTAGSLHPLTYSVSEGLCGPDLARALRTTVTEVLGTSPVVAAGEKYLVRGEYVLEGDAVDHVVLTSLGRSSGRPASLSQGSGTFEATAEILAVEAGREHVLDLVMIGKDGSDLGVRTRIGLSG